MGLLQESHHILVIPDSNLSIDEQVSQDFLLGRKYKIGHHILTPHE